MEDRYPDNCFRCGAPITWDDGGTFAKCAFCGKKNFPKKDILNLILDFFIIRNPREFFGNPKKLLIFLPIIVLILIIVPLFKKGTILIENKSNEDKILALVEKRLEDKKKTDNSEAKEISESLNLNEEKNERDFSSLDEGSSEAAQEYIERLKEIWNLPGKEKEVIKLANIALRLHKKSSAAYFHRANAKYQLKDYGGAIEDLNKSIELKPTTQAYFNRSMARNKIKEFKGSIDDLTEAIQIANVNGPVHLLYESRAFSKGKLNDYPGAINDYTRAIKIKPDYETAYKDRGYAKMRLEDYDGAINDFTKAIKIKPNYVAAYALRGITRQKLEDLEGAISDYTKAIKLEPDKILYKYRGIAKRDLEDLKGSCFDWIKASEFGDQETTKWVENKC